MSKLNIRDEHRGRLPRLCLVTAALWIAAPLAGYAQHWDDNGSDIYNTNSGFVGVGTSSPAVPLHVLGEVDNIAILECPDSGDCWLRVASGGVQTYLISGKSEGDIGYVGTLSNHQFRLRSGNTDRVTIDTSGRVGIGTTSPSTALHVVGDVTVSGNIAAKYQDIAEWVPAAAPIPAGTVVVLDPARVNSVVPSTKPYDYGVAGVVSDLPGLVLGEEAESKVKVATMGRVRVRVDATSAPIAVGDLLVTGAKEGTAMRSEPVDILGVSIHRPGTLIGKALEPLNSGEGEILVLLSLQ